MFLCREDLENISHGLFSEVSSWKSDDLDHNRVIIPAPPYLFIDQVLEIKKNDNQKGEIRYICKPYKNELFKNLDQVPCGILMEFFQGYMVLSDYLGLAKSEAHLLHRAIGGTIIYHDKAPKVSEDIFIKVQITKTASIAKNRIVIYEAQMFQNDTLLVELKNFKGIFAEKIDTKPTPYSVSISEKKKISLNFIEPKLQTLHGLYFCPKDDLLYGFYNIKHDDWFFKAHFKNDPCIPGSFLFQGVWDACKMYGVDFLKNGEPLVLEAQAKLSITPQMKKVEFFINPNTMAAKITVDSSLALEVKPL